MPILILLKSDKINERFIKIKAILDLKMAELTTLNFTDIHEYYAKLDILEQFLAEHDEVDVTTFSGDFIDDNPQRGETQFRINRHLQEFDTKVNQTPECVEAMKKLKQTAAENNININNLTPEQYEIIKADYEGVIEEHKKVVEEMGLPQILPGEYETSYEKIAESFGKLAEHTPIFGIMGNHDIVLGYESLEEHVDFLEKTQKKVVKGKTGVEFIVKGDLNTWEVPHYANNLPFTMCIAPQFIEFKHGNTIQGLEEKIAEAEKSLADAQEKFETATTEPEKQQAQQQAQFAKMNIDGFTYTPEQKTKIEEVQNQERERLGSPEEVDIYVAHKLPHCDKARPIYGSVCGDIAAEYSANANAVYGGHMHDGQIGFRNLAQLLQSQPEETTTIDEEEIPVFYLDETEPWEINPGTDYFTVTDFNKDKEVETVTIYQYVLG